MATVKINELEIRRLRVGSRITDTAIEGFVARRLPSGKVSFGYQYTDKATGKREWKGIGLHGAVTVDEARAEAKKAAGLVAAGRNPAGELKVAMARSTNTLDHVLDEYLALHADKHCRTAAAIRSNLAKHVRPVLGDKVIYDIGRGDIAKLIDKINKDTTRMGGIVHAYLRAVFNFWARRDDDFKNPIVRGMIEESHKPRTRVLTPDELADIWRALDELEHAPATFAAFVKVLMLTACRRCEVADMHTNELHGDRWIIPAARYKTNTDMIVPLIGAVKKLLPKIKNGFVFGCASHRHHQAAGAKPLRGYHKAKIELDAAIAAIRRREGRPAMKPWTFHDLRRTARTLLAELGVDREVAERCLGHTMGGIEETYNRHAYTAEKAAALEKLAAHVERITKAPTPTARTRLRVVAG